MNIQKILLYIVWNSGGTVFIQDYKYAIRSNIRLRQILQHSLQMPLKVVDKREDRSGVEEGAFGKCV